MKGKLTYKGKIELPFHSLLADPLMILRKLPDVASIEKHGDSYLVTMNPYTFHKALVVTPIGHVKLIVEANTIKWVPCEDVHPECNGSILGQATRSLDGNTDVYGEVEMEHPMINVMTWAAMKYTIRRIGLEYMEEFVSNFKNPTYNNSVPE